MSILVLFFYCASSFTTLPLERALSRRSLKKSQSLYPSPSIDSYKDYGYYLKLGVGTPSQKIHFALDTMPSEIFVSSVEVPELDSDGFNSSQSTTFQSSSNIQQFQYPSLGNLECSVSQDTFSYKDFKAPSTPFCLISQTYGNDDFYEGVFGLSFFNEHFFSNFLQNLGSQIEKNVLSVYINDDDSVITLGGFDPSKYGKGDEIAFELNQNLTKVTQISFGTQLIAFDPSYFQFTTRFRGFSGPSQYISQIQQYFLNNFANCKLESDDELTQVVCSDDDYEASNYPNITYTLNNVDFVFTPDDYFSEDDDDYVLDFTQNDDSNGNSIFYVGSVFFEKYYMVFDYDNTKLRLWHSAEPKEESRGISKGLIIAIAVIAFLAVSGTIVGICMCCRRKRLEEFDYKKIDS